MSDHLRIMPVLGEMTDHLEAVVLATELLDAEAAKHVADALVYTQDPDAPIPDESEWGRRR